MRKKSRSDKYIDKVESPQPLGFEGFKDYDRRGATRVNAIQRRWAYVNKKSSRSAACLELFIETDYCATNAALRNAYGGTVCAPALSVTRLYTKGHTFLAPSCFFVPQSLHVPVWPKKKKHASHTVEDAKSDSAYFFDSTEARRRLHWNDEITMWFFYILRSCVLQDDFTQVFSNAGALRSVIFM